MNACTIDLYYLPAWQLAVLANNLTEKISASEAEMQRLSLAEKEAAQRKCAQWYRERAELHEIYEIVSAKEMWKVFDPPPTSWVEKLVERWFPSNPKDKIV
ncbi:hypothetical protein MIND_01021600 [Mycena indigotica]|uniref:Uncharacterized protein n=1 Tax=Mycena indigotica TaxID=2126181 RepID=A0A8H6SAM6_9AGAR|nr:uncharacterized protein MIND_01021600 [Mycena indigotica]KAF7294837.1 hypothetical protein MIND_01021600 [Mycena indigotica]